MGRQIARRVVLRTRRVRILPARIAVTQLTAAHRVGARSFFLYDCLSRLQKATLVACSFLRTVTQNTLAGMLACLCQCPSACVHECVYTLYTSAPVSRQHQ